MKISAKDKCQHINFTQLMEILDELNIGAFTSDAQKRISRMNCSAQALIGLRESEVLGKICHEIFLGVPCMVACPLTTQDAPNASEPEVELDFENGKKHLISRFSLPVFNDTLTPSGCLTFLQDHSPIAELINRIHYEEKSLKIILDNLDVGIVTIDKGRRVTFFNKQAEQISGYEKQQILGKHFMQLFPKSSKSVISAIEHTISRGNNIEIPETQMLTRFDEVIPISIIFMPLKNEKKVIVGGMATFRDLTLIRRLKQEVSKQFTFQDLVGRSPIMQKIFERASIVAKTNATVLIQGETGTGKDILARAIHSAGRRATKPFVKVNCAAIPENLLESEMFGYIRGAFTGAESNKPGRFQEADGGTIFLDEIGDLPMALQAKLLRVLEDKEFYPLGSKTTRKVNVRIIAATNRDLEQLMERRQFRADLYYRLNVFRVDLPPLRYRKEDLPLLIHHISRKICAEQNIRHIELSSDAMKLLFNFDYRGNIRELENILEHAIIVRGNAQCIEPHHFPDYVHKVNDSEILAPYQKTTAHSSVSKHSKDHTPHDKDRRILVATLRKFNGHRGRTAQALGINRSTLWRRMKKYDLLGIDFQDLA